MMGGINPKQMEKMAAQMGLKQRGIDATEVVIKTKVGEIVVSNPQVVEVTMQGVKTFQVMGEVSERGSASGDVKLVMEKAGCSEKEAKDALERHGGDIAEAIMELQQ